MFLSGEILSSGKCSLSQGCGALSGLPPQPEAVRALLSPVS